jgi:hypothetical protein
MLWFGFRGCTILAVAALIVIFGRPSEAATLSTPAITVSNSPGSKYFNCIALNVGTKPLSSITVSTDINPTGSTCAPLQPGDVCIEQIVATVGYHSCRVTGGTARTLRVSLQLMDPATGVPIVAVDGR